MLFLAISIPFFGDSEPKTPEEASAKFRSDYRKATTYGAGHIRRGLTLEYWLHVYS